MDGERVFTVTELAHNLKAIVEAQFGIVVVRGEVTNLRIAVSGHTYFTLSDEGAQIRCVLFKGTKISAERPLVEDTTYLVWGRLSLYEPRTEISLVVSFFLPEGEGIEAIRLKALKEKLAKMGLFDESRKKKLPVIVEHIGVVTAPGGAAIQDIIRVGRDRYPRLRITLYPALVQGEGAEEMLIRGIEFLGSMREIDAIIIGRGGGAKEDLRVFNSEKLALAVAACPIPVIAAVGHETDRTILDLVASYSVSTPSAAAVLCSPLRRDLLTRLDTLCATFSSLLERSLQERQMRLDRLLLSLSSPAEWLQRASRRLSELVGTIEKRISLVFHRDERHFSALLLLLERHNPVAPLERGFAVVRQNERVVKRLASFNETETFTLRFADGETSVSPDVRHRKRSG